MANKEQDVMAEINELINKEITAELTRRGLLKTMAHGSLGVATISLAACKPRTEGSSALDLSQPGTVPIKVKLPDGTEKVVMIALTSFYEDFQRVKTQTPITKPPQDPAFKLEALVRGKAVGGLIGIWLNAKPYQMFEEMHKFAKGGLPADPNNPNAPTAVPLFQPVIGPAVVFQHPHVIEMLERTQDFTVDPYAPAMAIATSGAHFPPAQGQAPGGTTQSGYYAHYMLGTDNDNLYIPDGQISRYVVKREDIGMLRPMIRTICESLVKGIKRGDTFDAVYDVGRRSGLCRLSPVGVVGMYLGLPAYFPGTDGVGAYRVKGANNAFLKAGQEFDIDPEMAARFKFQKISKGIVPTPEDLYLWIKNAFRNIFNNFGKETDFYQAWANDGLEASEKLLAWSAQVIKYYKGIMKNNGGKVGTGSVPDTMITRLIKLQIEALSSPAKTAEFARMFDCSEADLKVRLADDRIQVNAFGCFVGAVANPEEANARIIDGILRLKEAAADPSKMKIKNGSYAELREACLAANDVRSDMSLINKYALELLRLTPQGEILLRLCVNDTELRSMPGVKFAKGQLIFNAHGAAMRDPNVLDDPLAFDVKRNDQTKAYSYQGDGREKEAPQSVVYLQHGYGRHKCLGRYASEMTMEEVVRAVVRLGDLERAGDLKMYDNNLYAESLKVKVL